MIIHLSFLRTLAATALFALTLVPASSQAASPLGGLTVAISDDGSKLVAGGDTRTLLVLDPGTLEVKERHWIGYSITQLAFNKDASVLAVHDTSGDVVLFATSDWTKKAELKKRNAFASNGTLIAGHDGDYQAPTVFVHDFADGAEKTSVTLPEKTKIAALALSGDGSKLAILTQGDKDEEEPEVAYGDIPKDLEKTAKEEFKQKNDGKTSHLLIHDANTGEQLSEAKLFYTTGTNARLYFVGDELISLDYSNVNAKLSSNGDTTVFQLENSFNYGFAMSNDLGLIASGGLQNFSITKTDSLTAVTGKIDKLPSWPEYWKGFASSDGGAIYGATTAYRVFKLKPDGSVETSSPIK